MESCTHSSQGMHLDRRSRRAAPGRVARALALQLIAGLCLPGARAHPVPLLALRLPLQRLGSLYRSALARRPVLTHCVQGAAISGVGDIACQSYAAKHDRVERGLRPHVLSLEQAPFLPFPPFAIPPRARCPPMR